MNKKESKILCKEYKKVVKSLKLNKNTKAIFYMNIKSKEPSYNFYISSIDTSFIIEKSQLENEKVHVLKIKSNIFK